MAYVPYVPRADIGFATQLSRDVLENRIHYNFNLDAYSGDEQLSSRAYVQIMIDTNVIKKRDKKEQKKTKEAEQASIRLRNAHTGKPSHRNSDDDGNDIAAKGHEEEVNRGFATVFEAEEAWDKRHCENYPMPTTKPWVPSAASVPNAAAALAVDIAATEMANANTKAVKPTTFLQRERTRSIRRSRKSALRPTSDGPSAVAAAPVIDVDNIDFANFT